MVERDLDIRLQSRRRHAVGLDSGFLGRLTQDPQVLGNGRAGDVRKTRGDLTRRILAVPDEAQDGHAARLAESVEQGGGGGHASLI